MRFADCTVFLGLEPGTVLLIVSAAVAAVAAREAADGKAAYCR
jgi:hypothetical protein